MMLQLYTGKLPNNDPFNNEIPAIKNFLFSPSVVNFIVKKPCNNKNPALRNKIFGPFRFVKARFQCNHREKNVKNCILTER